MAKMGAEERRARLAVRHRLARAHRAGDVAEVADDLVALHATDPASVFLASAARLRAPTVVAIERALYEERTIVRLLGMRRTMFVVPRELVPVVHAACTRALVPNQRRILVPLIERAGIAADADRWLAEVEDRTVQALAARGEAFAAELAADVPELRLQISMNEGKAYGGAANLTTRVLFLLAAGERIVRGRPRGSWISSQYRWAPIERWLPDGLPDVPEGAARVELARRWLRAFGPATPADLRWWTGWTAGEVNRALAEIAPADVELDGGRTGIALPGDLEPTPAPEPWVALLPALDPTIMGWQERGWFLGPHGPALFDRSGNVGPTVWWDGRIVGGWAQRKDGEVVYRLLEDVGADAVRAVRDAAENLTAWIGPVRVTPRFRTPLEQELSA
ncbi:MAG TPA: winged helix DNA-binding domain-containing protein [Candidatus Dormibacteraeota bacterium]|nr:winged helix DNA-binding domain-containing protein [Candidatus Dormibacteraeota bacterium]